MNLISVIVTNYNYAKYIGQCIESILNQSYQNFEVIVIDDESSDNSVEVIQEYQKKDKRIRLIQQKNGGQAKGFNTGFAVAKGTIIAFLDADDYWYPNKLEMILEYHKEYECVQHNLLINDKSKFTFLQEGRLRQRFLTEQYGFMGIIPTSGMSFNKNILNKVFPIPEQDYRICADNYIRVFSLHYADMISIDQALGCYRAHGENAWYSDQHIGINYNKNTLEKINKKRQENGIPIINKIDEANTFANVFIDSLSFDHQSRYIIFGNGGLGQELYKLLKNDFEIIGFSNSIQKKQREPFLDTQIFNEKYLLENPHCYDKIIIGVGKVVDVYEHLLEVGFSKEQILVPKF